MCAAELKQIVGSTAVMPSSLRPAKCALPSLPHCRAVGREETQQLAAAAGMVVLGGDNKGFDLPGYDLPCSASSADGRQHCCTVCAADAASLCARYRVWCSIVTLNREGSYATLKGGVAPSAVRTTLVRAPFDSQAVLVWPEAEEQQEIIP